MLRFGIIGMGKMGRIRAEEILARGDSELIAVCDSASDLRLDPSLDSVERVQHASELIAMDLDAVVICAYNNVAARYTAAALRAGKHVLCEKPPARFVSELEEVAREAQRSQRIVKYGFNHRYHYSVMEAKNLVDQHEFGKLLWVKGTYGKAGGAQYESEWRSDVKLSGGGILIDQGIHMLDLMLMFSGPVKRVQSVAQASYWKAPVEDNVFAILELESGAPMMLHSSAVLWRHQFLLELCFENGLLALDGILSATRSYADEQLIVARREFEDSSFALGKPREERITFDQDHSWKLELEEFVQAIRGHTPILNGTIADAIELMSLVEAIYEGSGFYDEASRRDSSTTG